MPQGDENIIDVQISCAADECKYVSRSGPALTPKVAAVLRALDRAGIKHRKGPVYDAALDGNLIVLWVGPRSPDSVSPGDCLGAEFKPRIGERHGCEMINQVSKYVPFVPP